MTRKIMPDEERWHGWVATVWAIAIATCVLSLWLIMVVGFVEVPKVSVSELSGQSYNVGTKQIVNWPVFGWAIGQSIAAVLLAALFSIANGAYRNSCQTMRMLAALGTPAEPDAQPDTETSTPVDLLSGLLVEQVRDASPLAEVLQPGARLLRINGHEPESEIDAARQIVKGQNEIVYCNPEGDVITGMQTMTPGPLHITFAIPAQ